MIDEKKIDKAYKKACDKALKNSVFNDNVHAYPYVRGFYDCAKWAFNEFLKNLWHQKDEEPEGYDELILLHYSAFNCYSLSQVKYFKSWKEFVERAPIENWLYIDDLFQKEGGEHD